METDVLWLLSRVQDGRLARLGLLSSLNDQLPAVHLYRENVSLLEWKA